MKKRARSISALLAVLGFWMMAAVPVFAADSAGFQVNPVLPENQRDGVKGYFDLIAAPGMEQELAIEVINTDEEELVVEVEAVTASTNLNGVVNYTVAGENDESLPHSIAELMQISEPVVTIPGNSTAAISVWIGSLEEAYDGYLLGGIHIKKRLSEEVQNSDQMILNQYSYAVAVKLAQHDDAVENDFLIDGIQAELVNGRASVVARIVNPKSVLVKGMTAAVEIFPEGENTPVMAQTMEGADMAPNSVLPFTLQDDIGQGVKAGAYVAVIEIEYDERTFRFTEAFEISGAQADAINADAVDVAPPGRILPGIILAAVLLLLIAAAALRRKRRA